MTDIAGTILCHRTNTEILSYVVPSIASYGARK